MTARGRAPKRRPASKPAARTSKRKPRASTERGFTEALAKLLRSRKIPVPKGLASAPPEAYASQPASVVDDLANLPEADLKRLAEQVGGYAKRQADRARSEWERSPLIAELRRRKLKEPPPPMRVAGASVSLAKPLKEWSDKELLKAAEQWSKLGR